MLFGDGLVVVGEGRRQQFRRMAARVEVGSGEGQAVDGLVVESEPGRQIVLAVAQPEQWVEPGGAVGGGDDGMGHVGEFFAGGEEFVFGFGELLNADRHPCGVVDDRSSADVGGDQGAQDGGQAVQTDRNRGALEILVECAAGLLPGRGGVGMEAQPIHPVIDQQVLIAVDGQRFPETVQDRQQDGLPVKRGQEQIANRPGEDELRANAEQPAQVGNPAGPGRRYERGGHGGATR